jgi:hypothetical protein
MTDKLTQAADLIEAFMQTLNIERDMCACCNVAKYADFEAYNQHKVLEAMVTKLRRMT